LKAVDVVVGVILKGSKFLVERRGLGEKLDPGVVYLPSGMKSWVLGWRG